MALFLLICLPFSLAQAQTVKVTGKVTDNLNEPMIGVSIVEKGTTNGCITDIDGNYTLNVNQGATIIFSYIGYVTQEKQAVAGVMKRDAGRSGGSRLRCAEEKLRDGSHFAGESRGHAKPYHQQRPCRLAG